jgi:hypothetical protein
LLERLHIRRRSRRNGDRTNAVGLNTVIGPRKELDGKVDVEEIRHEMW